MYDYSVKEYLKRTEKLFDLFELENKNYNEATVTETTVYQIKQEIDKIENIYLEYEKKMQDILNRNKEIIKQISPIKDLSNFNFEIEELINLEYIKFRYGYIPNESILEIKKELDTMPALFFKIREQEDVTSIVYLTTQEYEDNVDAFFNMQEFERILLPNNFKGKVSQFISALQDEYNKNKEEIEEYERKTKFYKKEKKERLIYLYNQLKNYEYINKIKKYIMHDKKHTFYMVIWVPITEVDSIVNMLESQEDIDYTIHDGKKEEVKEPTKLKNNKLIKPFEMLVNMYGFPNVKELDPTLFVAITSFLMFGFMFGDVGHGAIILLIGIILMRKKASLGPVMLAGGISSIIFGFIYGSVFGKENILKAKLISPMENINTMLISGIVVGSVFILIAMILNIVNGIKNKEIKKIFFDKNGLARFFIIWLCTNFNCNLFSKRNFNCTYIRHCNNCYYTCCNYFIWR